MIIIIKTWVGVSGLFTKAIKAIKQDIKELKFEKL